MNNLIFSFSIIIVGLSSGYLLRYFLLKTNRTHENINSIRKTLQSVAVLFLNPFPVLGTLWVVNLNNINLVTLPFVGVFSLFAGGLLAYLYARRTKMPNYQAGAFIVAGSFTNIGSLGALFCYIFLGENGYALVSIYGFFESFAYFAFGFPIAKSYSLNFSQNENIYSRIRRIFMDPFVLVTLASIIIGLLLNLSGIDRPYFFNYIIDLFIPLSILILLASIGMALRIKELRKYIKQGAIIKLIKLLIVPVTATSLAFILGYGEIMNGLPLKVVLILSSMPVGFTATIPPTIYDLDIDLTNACWLLTTLSLVFVFPIWLFLFGLI